MLFQRIQVRRSSYSNVTTNDCFLRQAAADAMDAEFDALRVGETELKNMNTDKAILARVYHNWSYLASHLLILFFIRSTNSKARKFIIGMQLFLPALFKLNPKVSITHMLLLRVYSYDAPMNKGVKMVLMGKTKRDKSCCPPIK